VKGGTELSQEQSVFSFDLNEMIHFSKGQEIAEIKGISLEPNISIQSNSDYIAIRGVIELSGEYRKEGAEAEAFIDDHEEFGLKRYVEQVTDLEGDEAYFQHRFPVEISVPAYRVNHSDDIKISVDAFDYELSSNNQLNLYATVQIDGINAERMDADKVDESEETKNEWYAQSLDEQDTKELATEERTNSSERDVEEINDGPSLQEEIDESIEQQNSDVPDLVEEESRNEEQGLDDQTEKNEKEQTNPTPAEEIEDDFYFEVTKKEENELSTHREEEAIVSNKKEKETESERWPFKEKTQTLAEFFGNEKPTHAESLTDSPSTETVSTHVHVESRDEETTDQEEVHDESEREEGAEEERDVSYLSDLFRHSEEEHYAKMRICIVQEEDTIETIADRFEVSSLQLIKQNKLTEDFDVEPGQLLYIPFKK